MANPAVTLALPAYNEAKRLERTVASILNQTMTDFELLIGDNCSTDGTLDIIRRLAKNDSRIRLLPAEKNLGAVWNFGRLLDEAKGEFFAWVGAHDLYHPEWLAHLVDILSADERLVSVYAQCARFLPDDSIFATSDHQLDTRKYTTSQRVPLIARTPNAGDRIYGLHRTSAAKQCPVTIVIRWDSLYLTRLGFFGDMLTIDEVLWFRFYDKLPVKTHNTFEEIFKRQYRIIYPDGKEFNVLHWMPHMYHLGCLLADGLKNIKTQGFKRIPLTLQACIAYHKRNAKVMPAEWQGCKQRIKAQFARSKGA